MSKNEEEEEFVELRYSRRTSLNDSPQSIIYLGPQIISMPIKIYEDLGSPAKLSISLSEKSKSVKLTSIPGEELGYVVKPSRLKAYSYPGETIYEVMLPKHRLARNILETYPLGYYKAIGGGVFEYLSKEFPK